MKRGTQNSQAFHALRLTISDTLQDCVLAAEEATDRISKGFLSGRNVPGLDDTVNIAYRAISGTPYSDPTIFLMASQAAATGPWIMSLGDAYLDIIKSLAATSDRLARAASRKAATDVFFEELGQDAVGVERSVRYGGDRIHPSAHFIRIYRTAHQGMKVATEDAGGPDKTNRGLAAGRLDDICSGATLRGNKASWDGIHVCIVILVIMRRIIMEDTEESITDATNRAAKVITGAVAGTPESTMIETILGDMIPNVTYYNSRRRAYDAAVREIHKICTDMITDAVGMCVFEALYEVFVAGAYRTAADKTFFRSNYRDALESACVFDPQKDIAGFEQGVPLPAHTTTKWWMNNALRYLADTDYVAVAKSQDNTDVMAFYETAYEAAYESASQASAALRTGGHI